MITFRRAAIFSATLLTITLLFFAGQKLWLSNRAPTFQAATIPDGSVFKIRSFKSDPFKNRVYIDGNTRLSVKDRIVTQEVYSPNGELVSRGEQPIYNSFWLEKFAVESKLTFTGFKEKNGHKCAEYLATTYSGKTYTVLINQETGFVAEVIDQRGLGFEMELVQSSTPSVKSELKEKLSK